MHKILKKLKIHGTHCASCEVLIERKLKKLEGVEKVHVNHSNGLAEIFSSREINLDEINKLIEADGYSATMWADRHKSEFGQNKNTVDDYLQMAAIFLGILSAYYILGQFNLVPTISISEQMSYRLIFLIGLFAAISSCIAVVGGLLLAVAEKWNESHPELNGIQKFRPHIYFNVGRIMGYTVFGAMVGGLGSVITLSTKSNGYLTIVVGLVMLLLGLQLLHIFPRLQRLSPKTPKFISHKIHNLSSSDSKSAPFILGSLTFFLPCGFTQALQLYVLASGDWRVGAMTMLVFSLGTLPALISLGALTSFVKGATQRQFLRFAGVLIVTIALFNINNGLALLGVNLMSPKISEVGEVKIVDGKQVVKMRVYGYNYIPSQFTVVEGIPVEWQIDGAGAAGCGKVIVMPTMGISQYLNSDGVTTIRFTPTKAGLIPFNCSMGMMTRGSAFNVLPIKR